MKLHLILLLTFGLVFTACGGSGSGTSTTDARDIAQIRIEAYANDNSEPMPTVQDYVDAGVSGVTAENLAEINAVVDDLEAEDVDTVEEINALVTSLGINIVPVANAQSITLNEDTSKTLTLTGSDANGDTLSYTVVSQPSHGTLSGTAPNLTYTPTANYFGVDSFTFKVNDGTDDSTVKTVNITVTDVAEPNVVPVANAQSITLNEDTANNAITLTGSDADNDALTYTIVSQPSHGTLSGTAPNLTYTPTANYFGVDSFTFKVNDGEDDSATVTVGITVTDVAEPLSLTLVKTGQTTEYASFDDGYHQKGVVRSYSRDTTKEVVTDNATGLLWQDDNDAKSITKNHADAITYCTNLGLGGFNNWRLPSIEELVYLTDKGRTNPALDPSFENVISNIYWSATTRASNTSDAWVVHFYYGNDYNDDKSGSYYVRCVRDGQ